MQDMKREMVKQRAAGEGQGQGEAAVLVTYLGVSAVREDL